MNRIQNGFRCLAISLLAIACSSSVGSGASEGGVRTDLGGPAMDSGMDVPVAELQDIPSAEPMTDAVGPSCGPSVPCALGQVCVAGMCARDTGPCATSNDCENDSYCVSDLHRCTPYAPGQTDPTCHREIRPGVFNPVVQCAFSVPPAGDAYPGHRNVLSTPMVVDLHVYRGASDPVRPSIIAVFDNSLDGGSEEPSGLIRILDGRTCTLQDNLGEQMVSHSSPPAVADLDGDGIPEIVAFKADGGLVAFHFVRSPVGTPRDGGADGSVPGDAASTGVPGAWHVWWRSANTDGVTPYNPTGGGWAGPTIADVNDDGLPEILRFGLVFNGQTGALIGGASELAALRDYSAGAFTVVQDVDEDGRIDLITGNGVYTWDNTLHDWAIQPYFHRQGCTGGGCGDGQVAVANFGDYSSLAFPDPHTPEIAVVSSGYVRIDTIDGRTVFGPIAIPGGGTGGPPTVADFDGDGLPEVAAAGRGSYSVFDPDCGVREIARTGGRCGTGSTTGVLWSRTSQDYSSSVTGSTSFDFDGDGHVDAIYADECFARVYNGSTGDVLFSQQHSSCTWYENPVMADVNGDFRSEMVLASNFNCGSPTTGIACPTVGPRDTDVEFTGLHCQDATDCTSGVCDSGYCRCTMDAQCCPPGETCTYVCEAPPMGTVGTGNTCRATRPIGVQGIHVFRDGADRWVRSRTIWNQHAYNVTNVLDDATIPRTRSVMPNWRDPTLNDFRTNVQGMADAASSPDLTASGGVVTCLAVGATVTARACNRGTDPVGDGVVVGFYDGDPAAGGTRFCRVVTPRALDPGACVDLTCSWATPPMVTPTTVYVVANDGHPLMECHAGNDLAEITGVVCRAPG